MRGRTDKYLSNRNYLQMQMCIIKKKTDLVKKNTVCKKKKKVKTHVQTHTHSDNVILLNSQRYT